MSDADPATQLPCSTAPLSEAERLFVERWARMASSWGVPRSMAEVHALLFVSGRALTSDDLMAQLGISRGNASMTIRTLEEWGIVRREQRPTDRRDYFVAEQDTLALFGAVIRIRKEREIDPLLALVDDCRTKIAAAPDPGSLAGFQRKLDDIQFFVSAVDALATQHLATGSDGMRALLAAIGGAK